MPLRRSNVPELVKLTPMMVVVPVLADLRKVPPLSNRQAPEATRLAAFCAWNNAPARLVMAALVKLMLPTPVQSRVPLFSKVRLVRDAEPEMAALRVTPAGMIVRP